MTPRIRFFGAAVGLGLLGWIISTVGWTAIAAELQRLGWWIVPILLFYMVIFGLDTWGWRFALGRRHVMPWRSLFLARLAGEAANYVTPLASMGGEPVKAYLLRRHHGIPMAEGIGSVVIAKTTLTIGLLLFAICGAALASWQGSQARTLVWLSWLVTFGLSLGVALFVLAQRAGLFRRVATMARGAFGARFPLHGRHGHAIDHSIQRFYRSQPRRVALSVLFHFLGWVAGVAEVWFILQILGIPVTVIQAWIIESLWQLLKAGAFLIPGAIGAQEGGILLIFLSLGLSSPAGVALGLIRRIRELVWAAAGLIVWSGYSLNLFQSSIVHRPSSISEGAYE